MDTPAATLRPPSPVDLKLGELVLYLARHSHDDIRFDRVKLGALLFSIDFEHHRQIGNPVTGATYRRTRRGPAPDGLDELLAVMQRDGRVALAQRNVGGVFHEQVVALREPVPQTFDSHELDLVFRTLSRFRSFSGPETVAQLEGFCGWPHVGLGKIIGYSVALVGGPLPSQRAIDAGRKLTTEKIQAASVPWDASWLDPSRDEEWE